MYSTKKYKEGSEDAVSPSHTWGLYKMSNISTTRQWGPSQTDVCTTSILQSILFIDTNRNKQWPGSEIQCSAYLMQVKFSSSEVNVFNCNTENNDLLEFFQ